MSNHDIHNESDEKFVPLKDNNNNLSFVKIISSVLLLGALIFLITTGVQYAGAYLTNEEQVEFKKDHGRYTKDSDENRVKVTNEVEELYKMKYRGESAGAEMKDHKTDENKEEKKVEEPAKEENKMGGKHDDEKKMDEKKMENEKGAEHHK
jgi:hypothetical protein